jgi:hypothetical protein
MNRIILIFATALLLCGFALPETPEARAERAKEEKAWAKSVSSRYDLKALFSFLKETTAERKSWNQISLTNPRIGSGWKMQGHGMVTGDWSFAARDPAARDDFTLSFIYPAEKGDRRLVMRCIRAGKNVFRLVGIESEDVVVLMF